MALVPVAYPAGAGGSWVQIPPLRRIEGTGQIILPFFYGIGSGSVSRRCGRVRGFPAPAFRENPATPTNRRNGQIILPFFMGLVPVVYPAGAGGSWVSCPVFRGNPATPTNRRNGQIILPFFYGIGSGSVSRRCGRVVGFLPRTFRPGQEGTLESVGVHSSICSFIWMPIFYLSKKWAKKGQFS